MNTIYIARRAKIEHVCDSCGQPILAHENYMDGRDAQAYGKAFRIHQRCVSQKYKENEKPIDNIINFLFK